LVSWIIWIAVLVILIGVYIWLFFYTRKRQRAFDEQYYAAKERHEVFVLSKKIVKERPKTGWFKYAKFKNYHVVGRVNLSQTVKGIHMSRMQTVTFQTTKTEYEKIQPNHKYKMDIAGNYIGLVVNAPLTKDKKKTAKADLKSGKKVKKGSK
jgi:hypothetical protein